MKRVLVISLAVVLTLCLSMVALPAKPIMANPGDIYVPDDYLTINEALAHAVSGDTIHVAAGTYNENIELKGGVIIQGSGADVTTINGTGSDSVVYGNQLGSTAKLDGFTITDGYHSSQGGGIYLQVGSSPTISNCIITGNSAGSLGGGISIYNQCSPTISNCVITGNSASYGGGIFAWSSDPTIINCTITGNSATDGGGMYNWSSSSNITNSIIYGNTITGSGPNIFDLTSTPSVTYSCVGGGYSGTGNIDADPSFENPGAGNYHLKVVPTLSPCIDAGNNNAPGILEFDLDGNDRIADGDGVGGPVVDMGAYEAAAVIDTIPVEIDIKPGSDPNSINPDSKGVIPVAILTTADFDAASVNVTTVSFGPDEASPVHYALEDVDSDSDIDMILHFKTQDVGLGPDDEEATLTGQTVEGGDITGTDSVRIVPPKGKVKKGSNSNPGQGNGQGNGNDNSNSGQGNGQGNGDDNSNPGQGKGKGKDK